MVTVNLLARDASGKAADGCHLTGMERLAAFLTGYFRNGLTERISLEWPRHSVLRHRRPHPPIGRGDPLPRRPRLRRLDGFD